MRRLIIFLIRIRLKVKRCECFRFYEQRSPYDYYLFTNDSLIKMKYHKHKECVWWETVPSSCSLNWLLNDNCKIIKIDECEHIRGVN
jgi:hypothetical protein